MIKVTMEVLANNHDGSQSDQDQGSTLAIETSEIFTFSCRDDSTGMPEIELAAKIRNFLRYERLK